MTGTRRLALLVLVLAACARATGPVEIPAEELPFAVGREPETSETAAPRRAFVVYFVRDGRLVDVRKEGATEFPRAEAALRALLDGPDRATPDFSTEIPAGVRLLDIVGDGEVRVDLSGEFQEPAPSDRIALRVAQVVWTLTALPAVRSVAFLIDGEPVAVTTQDGTAVDRPVVRADYSTLAPSA